MAFPKDFVWGVATSSYQIEGAAMEEGRGECIWTRFSHTPDKVRNNDNGDIACQHYYRYADDIKLMQDLAVQAYRFSISWPRVLPEGVGRTNEAGIDFYDRLVDTILAANIVPYVTLYHWDLPQALQDKGGWANPDSIKWFTDYTDMMTRLLGDRIKHWVTFNEPLVISHVGHLMGVFAPGIKDMGISFTVAHHLNLSHGAAVPVIRANVDGAQVGIVLDLNVVEPASSSEEDINAARLMDGFLCRWFVEPIAHGTYPADMLELVAPMLPPLDFDAVKVASVPIDYFGLNYYHRQLFAAGGDNPVLPTHRVKVPDVQHTAMDWEVYPQGLTKMLLRLRNEYGLGPIYITENGCAYDDPAPINGVVEDPQRVAYYASHWAAIEAALSQGVDVAGYFAWSLMDNFEWAEGYSKRFGIVHVDFETQERIPKRSALTYRNFIRAHVNSSM